MKRKELIELREKVNQEIKRRERIKELLSNELVCEYLTITNTKPDKLNENDLKEIIEKILLSFTITKTNGIYVCTSASHQDYRICYEETEYYSEKTKIDSKYADIKRYTDIESNKCIVAVKDDKNNSRPLISNFENNNIVLNPYNTYKNQNGYKEVRYDFFETAIREGEAKAKKKILSKYPRL